MNSKKTLCKREQNWANKLKNSQEMKPKTTIAYENLSSLNKMKDVGANLNKSSSLDGDCKYCNHLDNWGQLDKSEEDLEKGKNKREQRSEVFGNNANAPRTSDKRMKMMQAVRDFSKNRHGLNMVTASGKRDESGNLREQKPMDEHDRPVERAIDGSGPRFVRGVAPDKNSKSVDFDRQSRLLSELNAERLDQIDRGEIVFDKESGWTPGTNANAKINQRARVASKDDSRKDSDTLMRAEEEQEAPLNKAKDYIAQKKVQNFNINGPTMPKVQTPKVPKVPDPTIKIRATGPLGKSAGFSTQEPEVKAAVKEAKSKNEKKKDEINKEVKAEVLDAVVTKGGIKYEGSPATPKKTLRGLKGIKAGAPTNSPKD